MHIHVTKMSCTTIFKRILSGHARAEEGEDHARRVQVEGGEERNWGRELVRQEKV